MKITIAIVILSLLIFVTSITLLKKELNPVQQDLESAESIQITSNEVRIELFKTEDGEERLEGLLHPKRTLTVKKRANSLTVEISKRNKIYAKEEVLQIFITKGKSISIRAGSGNIDITDLESSDLTIETGSGDVSTDNANGRMSVSAGSGDITIFRSSGVKMFNAGSGDIAVRDSDGDISTSSSSGDITLNNIVGELIVSTNSGDIHGNKLEITTDSTFQSNSGDIALNNIVGGLVVSTNSGDIYGNKLEVATDSTFQSNSGGIEINFINAKEDLKFDVSSKSGTMSLGKTEASGTLLLGSGPILITGRTSSGDQEYSFTQ